MMPSSLARSSGDWRRSRSGGGWSDCSHGSISSYWAYSPLRSGTRSFRTGICGSGVMRLVPFLRLSMGVRQAKRVRSIDVHGAGAADPLAAGSPERQGRIDLVVDLDQRIENHRSAAIAIDFERIERRGFILHWIPAIDSEALDVLGVLRRWPPLAFLDFRIGRKRKFGHMFDPFLDRSRMACRKR